MTRIIKYEFKKTRTGTKVILWAPAGRRGKTVLASQKLRNREAIRAMFSHPDFAEHEVKPRERLAF